MLDAAAGGIRAGENAAGGIVGVGEGDAVGIGDQRGAVVDIVKGALEAADGVARKTGASNHSLGRFGIASLDMPHERLILNQGYFRWGYHPGTNQTMG
nr:hypothetical protein [uncultured Methanoregula sp.]